MVLNPAEPSHNDTIMNKSQIAKLLNVSRPTVYQWEKEGILDQKLKEHAKKPKLEVVNTEPIETGELKEQKLPDHNQSVHHPTCPCGICKPLK